MITRQLVCDSNTVSGPLIMLMMVFPGIHDAARRSHVARIVCTFHDQPRQVCRRHAFIEVVDTTEEVTESI